MGSFDKSKVHNLPAHAQIQTIRGTIYVYFAYCFSINGKRKQERDYIGVIDTEAMKFVPNGFFLREKPSFQHRALSRWKDPDKRKREESKRIVKDPKKPASSIQLVDYLPQSNIISQLNNCQDRLITLIQEAPQTLQSDMYGLGSEEHEEALKSFNKKLDQINDSFNEVEDIFDPVFTKAETAQDQRESADYKTPLVKEKLKRQADVFTVYLLYQLFDQLSRNMQATWTVAQQSRIKSFVLEDTMGILSYLSENFRLINEDLKERFDMDGLYNNLIASQYLNTPREDA